MNHLGGRELQVVVEFINFFAVHPILLNKVTKSVQTLTAIDLTNCSLVKQGSVETSQVLKRGDVERGLWTDGKSGQVTRLEWNLTDLTNTS